MKKTESSYNKSNIKALKLRTIQPQVAWGGRPLSGYNTNLLALFDHEFVLVTGTGFTYIENSSVHTRKAFIVEPHSTDIAKILCICAAKEGKYVAAVAKTAHEERNQLYIVVYNTHNHMQDNVKPHEIKYTANINFDHGDPLEARGVAFSPDCSLLACITNHPHIGVVVFDHFKGDLYQTIPTDALPISISFHPLDPGKICVTGECNFVKLWRFTNKSVHAAPVSNLKRGFYSYICHNWVPPYAEGILVVGTDGGFLATIQNCEQRAHAQQVFGKLDSYDPSQNAVAHILIRGDIVIAASVSNQIAVFEVRRVLSAKGVGGLTATLVPLAFYSLENTTRIYGLQFCAKESNTSYTLMASTADTLAFLDM
ncbi:WD40 repeat domain-containing protein, partial [archaeon]